MCRAGGEWRLRRSCQKSPAFSICCVRAHEGTFHVACGERSPSGAVRDCRTVRTAYGQADTGRQNAVTGDNKMTWPWRDALPLDLDTVPFGHRTVVSSHYYSVGQYDTKLDVCPMYKFKIHSEIADVHLRVAKAGLSGTYESRGPGVHALEGSPCFLGVKSRKFSSCNLLKCNNFCLDVHKKKTIWLK